MNELQTFTNEKFGSVRTVIINDEPYFVGKDVAEILGYSNPQKAIRDHVDEEDRGVNEMDTPGGFQPMTVINESGLYSLIFGSKLEKAKEFKHWVTSEVLPALRKTGSYSITPDSYMIEDPIERARAWIKEQEVRRGLEMKNSQLTVTCETMRPKAEFFDDLVDRNLLTSIRDTAKELKVKEKAFVSWLIEHGYLYRDKKSKLTPKAGKGDGLFEVKESKNEKTGWAGTQTLITPKGRETFRLLTEGMRYE